MVRRNEVQDKITHLALGFRGFFGKLEGQQFVTEALRKAVILLRKQIIVAAFGDRPGAVACSHVVAVAQPCLKTDIDLAVVVQPGAAEKKTGKGANIGVRSILDLAWMDRLLHPKSIEETRNLDKLSTNPEWAVVKYGKADEELMDIRNLSERLGRAPRPVGLLHCLNGIDLRLGRAREH